MNTNIKTLSTVAALGADATVSNGFLYVTGLPPMLLAGIYNTSVVAPVTEVLQVTTGTVTPANSTYYEISLFYVNKTTNQWETRTFSYTSDSSATDQEVATSFRNQINACNATIPVVGTGTTTLILTGETGYAQFTVTNIGVGTIAFNTGIAAVNAVGLGSQLIQNQYYDPITAPLVPTSYYYQVYMKYANEEPTGSAQNQSNLVNINVLYVLSTATNVETLVGTYGTLTQALNGYITTYVAGTGTLAATAATDLLTLAGGGEFAAQGIVAGDVLFQVGETTYYLVNNVISTTTANAIVGVDNGAAAYTIIHRTRI